MELSHLIIVLILLGCMATYIPVFMCLFFSAVLGFVFFTDLPILLLAQSLYRSLDNFALVVVLFFILCGNIMTAGSIVEKLIKVANALVSWLPGGLGMAGVLACGLFGAISGSTVATVVALGGFMIPALIKNGSQYRHDPLQHDQQCFFGGTFFNRLFTGCSYHAGGVPLFLLLFPEKDRNCTHAGSQAHGGAGRT
jgi:C4-dicarboxylate transporter DctM subunit